MTQYLVLHISKYMQYAPYTLYVRKTDFIQQLYSAFVKKKITTFITTIAARLMQKK